MLRLSFGRLTWLVSSGKAGPVHVIDNWLSQRLKDTAGSSVGEVMIVVPELCASRHSCRSSYHCCRGLKVTKGPRSSSTEMRLDRMPQAMYDEGCGSP